MKIQLLIATDDKDYAKHLSSVLSENRAESFEVTVCSDAERIEGLLSERSYDVALFDAPLIPRSGLEKVRLPLLLWDMLESGGGDVNLIKIRKYQRVSRLSSDILDEYSKATVGVTGFGSGKAKITAVWSPVGGVGKTTAALAYATQKAVGGGNITYLDLEYFSSTSVYFPETGKSISTAFERLGSNAALLLKAISLKDSGSGICYFSPPNNYDDMNELTAEDVKALVDAAAENSDEVVVDLPCACDERTRKVLEAANAVYLVTDGSKTAAEKIQQFITQHNLYAKVYAKTVLVANKGAKVNNTRFKRMLQLPSVTANDPVSVCKTLSEVRFE